MVRRIGINAERLVAAIKTHGHKNARHVAGLSEIAAVLEPELKAGDLVITMGAGNVWKVGDELLQRLN